MNTMNEPNTPGSARDAGLSKDLFGANEMICLAVLLAVCFWLYWPTLTGPFIFDDMHNILYNQDVQINSVGSDGLMQAAFSNPDFFRPLPMASFGLNYYFHGLNTKGYHLVNICIHFLTGAFLFLFFRQMFMLPFSGVKMKHATLPAALAALLWMAHPVQTQSVAYIVQRMNAMAGMFFVLTLLLYLYARTSPDKRRAHILFGLGVLSAFCALASKENTLVLPVIIILMEWFFFRDLSKRWLTGNWWKIILGLAAFGGLAWMAVGEDAVGMLSETYARREFSMWERVMTEWRVVVWYLSLLAAPLPSRMTLLHDFPVSHSLFSNWQTLPALGIIIALIVLAVALAKKERLISFAILWFFITLAIESSVIGLELVFEHRLYVPSMMLAAALVVLAFRVIAKPMAAALLILGVTAAFGWSAYERNTLWGDGVALMQDCAAKFHDARPYYNLGHTQMITGDLQAAAESYKKGLQIDELWLDSHSDAKPLRVKLVQHRAGVSYTAYSAILYEMGNTEEAVQGYYKALTFKPDSDLALNNLGLIMAKNGKLREAVDYYQKSLAANPQSAETLANMGDAQIALGNLEKAKGFYTQALSMAPNSFQVHASMGKLLVNLGEFQQGVDHFTAALAIDHQDQETQNDLLLALRIINEIERLEDAIQIQPNQPANYFALATLLGRYNKADRAEQLCLQGLEKAPSDPNGLNQLAKIRMDQGRYGEAEKLLLETARVLGENIPSLYNLACMYARQNKKQEAVKYLKAAVDKGFGSWELLQTDPDMANIRDTEFFRDLMRQQAGGTSATDMG